MKAARALRAMTVQMMGFDCMIYSQKNARHLSGLNGDGGGAFAPNSQLTGTGYKLRQSVKYAKSLDRVRNAIHAVTLTPVFEDICPSISPTLCVLLRQWFKPSSLRATELLFIISPHATRCIARSDLMCTAVSMPSHICFNSAPSTSSKSC